MFKRPYGIFMASVVSLIILFSIGSTFCGAAEIKLLQPEEGASIPGGKITFIGKVCGAESGQATLILNGVTIGKLSLEGGVFYRDVTLKDGKNSVRVLYPGARSLDVTIKTSRKSKYLNHIEDMECGDCHGKGFTVRRPEDSLCYKCHDRKDEAKLVHGPLGSGSCAICHDPHGSKRVNFLRAETSTLCTSCHDQSSSMGHVSKAKNRGCHSCHNPHSSDKEFFLR